MCSYHEQPILNNINGLLKKEFWHLLGPNGSGKSTLLSLINGDNTKVTPRSLSLWCEKRKWRKHLGYKRTLATLAMTDLFQK
jgi:molybdate transport system ATP-binding protein